MTTLIDILKYTEKFSVYPEEFYNFCVKNNVKLPGLDTNQGQAYALMGQPEVCGKQHLTRKETALFFEQIQMKNETADTIQAFNKQRQIGLVPKDTRGKYCLEYPFQLDMKHVYKRIKCVINGNKDDIINQTKSWWKENLIDIPNDKWHVGHLDPTVGDASEQNLAYQPPLQASYRDRFKWCSLFHKMWPTNTELLPNYDKYYTVAEQLEQFKHLQAKFAPPPPASL